MKCEALGGYKVTSKYGIIIFFVQLTNLAIFLTHKGKAPCSAREIGKA
jgi:hypothetical protein